MQSALLKVQENEKSTVLKINTAILFIKKQNKQKRERERP